ncbi:hypothetical protein KDJ21_005485 [Metabacillus litoralis]|uniref:hypothetical protein n=1 Tax=Metabacillus TaxID=2675233 RepID=UPI001BA11C8B|nr:hypothetical protein [Metabacillus litoralis]UHA61116.1 hypothetical protein KDJ21_005485 [Metabacillus litoralis]
MHRPFIRTTHYPAQRTVVHLEVASEASENNYKCTCKKDLEMVQDYTFVCRNCREEFMGPLLTLQNNSN